MEDDVRIEAVQALVSAAKKDISVIGPEMLELVKERTLDKKVTEINMNCCMRKTKKKHKKNFRIVFSWLLFTYER